MNKENYTTCDPLGLKTKRESLGLTLKDVFLNTRISVINLEAIENGKFHELPVPIYTRNFIKTYAGALGIQSKPILESYEAYLDSQKINKTEPAEVESKKESNVEKVALYKTYIWTSAVIVVIIAVVFFISNQYQPTPEIAGNQPKIMTNTPPAAVNTPGTPAGDQIKTEASPSAVSPATNKRAAPPVQSAPPAVKNAAAAKPAVQQKKPVIAKTAPPLPAAIGEEASLLQITATEETWLRIKTDNNPPFQILLKPGEKIEREGTDFDLDVGNAGGIKMQFKGKVIENLGKSGQVIHLRLP
jgi:cytoskeleton protein RodZ